MTESGDRAAPTAVERWRILLAAILAAVAIFAVGYGVGNRDDTFRTNWYMPLRGANGAPEAVGNVQGGPIDKGGNTPLTLRVRGLAELAGGQRYALFLLSPDGSLVRCGDFVVGKGMTEIRLSFPGLTSEPYGWAVARETATGAAGAIMLRATRLRVESNS